MDTIVKDINIASFLLTSEEVHLTKVEREGRIVLFYFSPKDIAEKLILDYWSDNVSIPPRKLMTSLRSIKDLIFSES